MMTMMMVCCQQVGWDQDWHGFRAVAPDWGSFEPQCHLQEVVVEHWGRVLTQ